VPPKVASVSTVPTPLSWPKLVEPPVRVTPPMTFIGPVELVKTPARITRPSLNCWGAVPARYIPPAMVVNPLTVTD